MRADIHPDYQQVTLTCNCGNKIEVGSTLPQDIHIDVCSACHPFYTGQQKEAASGGRIDKFKQRFGSLSSRPKKKN